MFNYNHGTDDNPLDGFGRPVTRLPSMSEYDRLHEIIQRVEEHTGFCLGLFNVETCKSCYCVVDCLELRHQELLERGV